MQSQPRNLPGDLPGLAREIEVVMSREAEIATDIDGRDHALRQDFQQKQEALSEEAEARHRPNRIELGHLLIAARALCSTGKEFELWLREHTQLGRSTAFQYMQLAKADDPKAAEEQRKAGQTARKRKQRERARPSVTADVTEKIADEAREPREPVTYVPPSPQAQVARLEIRALNITDRVESVEDDTASLRNDFRAAYDLCRGVQPPIPWEKWVTENTPFSVEQADRYRKGADLADHEVPKADPAARDDREFTAEDDEIEWASDASCSAHIPNPLGYAKHIIAKHLNADERTKLFVWLWEAGARHWAVRCGDAGEDVGLDEEAADEPPAPAPADNPFEIVRQMEDDYERACEAYDCEVEAGQEEVEEPVVPDWENTPGLLDAEPTTLEELTVQFHALSKRFEGKSPEESLKIVLALGDKLEDARRFFPTVKAWKEWISSLKACPMSTSLVNAALGFSTKAQAELADAETAAAE
jgi:hypothetical protein